jgi:hypothetical protein
MDSHFGPFGNHCANIMKLLCSLVAKAILFSHPESKQHIQKTHIRKKNTSESKCQLFNFGDTSEVKEYFDASTRLSECEMHGAPSTKTESLSMESLHLKPMGPKDK